MIWAGFQSGVLEISSRARVIFSGMIRNSLQFYIYTLDAFYKHPAWTYPLQNARGCHPLSHSYTYPISSLNTITYELSRSCKTLQFSSHAFKFRAMSVLDCFLHLGFYLALPNKTLMFILITGILILPFPLTMFRICLDIRVFLVLPWTLLSLFFIPVSVLCNSSRMEGFAVSQ